MKNDLNRASSLAQVHMAGTDLSAMVAKEILKKIIEIKMTCAKCFLLVIIIVLLFVILRISYPSHVFKGLPTAYLKT